MEKKDSEREKIHSLLDNIDIDDPLRHKLLVYDIVESLSCKTLGKLFRERNERNEIGNKGVGDSSIISSVEDTDDGDEEDSYEKYFLIRLLIEKERERSMGGKRKSLKGEKDKSVPKKMMDEVEKHLSCIDIVEDLHPLPKNVERERLENSRSTNQRLELTLENQLTKGEQVYKNTVESMFDRCGSLTESEKLMRENERYVSSPTTCSSKKSYVDGCCPDDVPKEERLKSEKAFKNPITENPNPNRTRLKKIKLFCGNIGFTDAKLDISKKERSLVDEVDEKLKVNKKIKKETKPTNSSKHKGGISKKNGYFKELPEIPLKLPDEYYNYITQIGGQEVNLVIQKPLYESDTCKNNNRLLMPFRQLISTDFLTEEEKAKLNKKENGKPGPGISVRLIDTKLEQWVVSLRRWEMNKSSQYAVATTWHAMVEDNKLKEKDVIQLWSFRVGSELHFALVLISKEEEEISGSCDCEGKST